jgi:hypothetical protein
VGLRRLEAISVLPNVEGGRIFGKAEPECLVARALRSLVWRLWNEFIATTLA